MFVIIHNWGLQNLEEPKSKKEKNMECIDIVTHGSCVNIIPSQASDVSIVLLLLTTIVVSPSCLLVVTV